MKWNDQDKTENKLEQILKFFWKSFVNLFSKKEELINETNLGDSIQTTKLDNELKIFHSNLFDRYPCLFSDNSDAIGSSMIIRSRKIIDRRRWSFNIGHSIRDRIRENCNLEEYDVSETNEQKAKTDVF